MGSFLQGLTGLESNVSQSCGLASAGGASASQFRGTTGMPVPHGPLHSAWVLADYLAKDIQICHL